MMYTPKRLEQWNLCKLSCASVRHWCVEAHSSTYCDRVTTAMKLHDDVMSPWQPRRQQLQQTRTWTNGKVECGVSIHGQWTDVALVAREYYHNFVGGTFVLFRPTVQCTHLCIRLHVNVRFVKFLFIRLLFMRRHVSDFDVRILVSYFSFCVFQSSHHVTESGR